MSIYYIDLENGDDGNDGTTWALAWKTFTLGATAARIAPGDIIRISKTPDPVSIGDATWTNESATVTLASAQTLTIDNCESAWTANGSGDTTVALTSVITDAKEGSNCMKLTLDASPQTSIMQAYYQIADTDFSSYQKISFWIKNSAAIIANNWKVCLCSDTAGATPVDTFYITPIPSISNWLPLTLTKDGGGNLGASIQSIAIYTDSVAPTASSNILVDNFIACTTSGLNLQSLISKNGSAQDGTEAYYNLRSIDGTTLIIDGSTKNKANTTTIKYYGTSETVTTYHRETYKTELATTTSGQVSVLTDSGTLGQNIEYQGGYEVGTTNQNGETYLDGLNCLGAGIYTSVKSYITFSRLNLYRYYYNLYLGTGGNWTIENVSNINSAGLLALRSSLGLSTINIKNMLNCGDPNNTGSGAINVYGDRSIYTINNIIVGAASSTSTAITFGDAVDNIFYITNIYGTGNTRGIDFGSGYNNRFFSTNIDHITYTCYNTVGAGTISFFNSVTNPTTGDASYTITAGNGCKIFHHDYNNIQNNHMTIEQYGISMLQSTTTQTGSGFAWQVTLSSTTRDSTFPFNLPLAKVLCESGKTYTVKVYCKKDDATNVSAQLRCSSTWINGITEQTDTKADDTNWEQLSISFTPTENGVVEIFGDVWCSSITNANVYWDTFEVTSA